MLTSIIRKNSRRARSHVSVAKPRLRGERLETRRLLTGLDSDPPTDVVALRGAGGTYRESFEEFGLGESATPLPTGWRAAAEGDGHDATTASFSSLAVDGVFSAGATGSTERALVLGGTQGNAMALFGQVSEQPLHALRVSVDLEAWGAFAPASANGQAAFDIVLEADLGNGYTSVADLGTASTAPTLSPPTHGSFSASLPVAESLAGSLITSADFNDDGDQDVAIADTGDSGGYLAVYLGDGRGGFVESARLTSLSVPNDLVAADFDGDGHLDIAVADWDFFAAEEGENDGVYLFYGQGNGKFREGDVLIDGSGPTSLDTADIDGDSLADLVVSNALSNTISIFYGTQNDTLVEDLPLESGLLPFDITLSDLNNDDLLDVVTADLAEGTLTMHLSEDGESFREVTVLEPDAAVLIFFVDSGDFDSDGDVDLVITYSIDDFDFFQILSNDGTGAVTPTEPVFLGPFSDTMEIQDMDQDGDLDIAVPAVDINQSAVFFNRGDATFDEPILIPSTGRVFTLAALDADNDGDHDLAIATATGIEIAWNQDALLDGNALGNRTRFHSGITPLARPLPTETPFRIRFDVPASINSQGYVYGVDNVVVETFPGGDANGDGRVNFADFVALSTNFGRNGGLTLEQGDFDGNGKVNFSDFIILAANFGT